MSRQSMRAATLAAATLILGCANAEPPGSAAAGSQSTSAAMEDGVLVTDRAGGTTSAPGLGADVAMDMASAAPHASGAEAAPVAAGPRATASGEEVPMAGDVDADAGRTGSGADEASGMAMAAPDAGPAAGLQAEEVCYEFRAHGQATPGDPSPYSFTEPELIVDFYFAVPWTEPVAVTRWQTLYDNTQVLHHWLLYDFPPEQRADGSFETSFGAHLGADVELLAGWAIGGDPPVLPTGVAMRMPGPGRMLLLEWHLLNNTGAMVQDRSGVQVCVIPQRLLDEGKLAGITWMGTENLNGIIGMPPNAESTFTSTCTPSWNGADELQIVSFLPHMHLLGTRMNIRVLRADGTEDLVLSEPFVYDRQVYYDMDPPVVMRRGDRIQTECIYFNDTSEWVAWGPSVEQEMCLLASVSYPAGALDNPDNGPPSFTGSSNACIQ